MAQQDLLNKVVQALDGSGSAYMLTGSFASSMQGEPRLSHDIDLVVDLTPQALPELLKRFPSPDFYLDEQSIREAISAKTMFRLLHVSEGDKVDFWLLTDDPFDIARFARRQSEAALDLKLFVSSPEDTILMKLRWAKLSGGSEKHLHDALRVYEVQFGGLDLDYLGKWIKRLDLEDHWRQLLQRAAPL
jgi:hypothetical protein